MEAPIPSVSGRKPSKRQNLRALRRRLDYLRRRIREGVSENSERYMRAEMRALEWVLELVDE